LCRLSLLLRAKYLRKYVLILLTGYVCYVILYTGLLSHIGAGSMRTKNAQLYEIIKAQVDAHYDRFGRSPTVREIEAGTGIPRSTVQRYLAAMQAEGEIEYDGVRSVRTRRMGRAGSGYF